MQRENGYLKLAVPSAPVRWAVCAVAVAGLAAAAVLTVRSAVAEALLDAVGHYPMPVSAIETAIDLAPDNPAGPYRFGLYHMDVANPPDLDGAGRWLERAVDLAPNRSGYWLTLGRQREIAGHADAAADAYRRAAELAPWSWRPQWMLGNHLIRQGRAGEAAEALRMASERNDEIAALAIRTIWRATEGNVGLASRVARTSGRARGDLIALLLAEKRIDDALALWREAAAGGEDGSDLTHQGNTIAAALTSAGRGTEATEVWNRVAPSVVSKPGEIANAGFEEPIAAGSSPRFSWSVKQAPEARVSAGAGREGGKALRVDYRAGGGTGFGHALQQLLVSPGVSYTLSFWAATEDLQSGGPPAVTLSDPSGKVPRVEVTIPTGTTAWTRYELSFEAPPGGVVSLGLGRASCGEVCPIFGAVLVDDFALEAR